MTDTPLYTFNKQEKLKSRKLLEALFANGKTFLVFPVKVLYMVVEEPLDFPVKVGVGASSKKFKRAMDRNRIKRLLRENYRLQKQPLHHFTTAHNKQVAVFLMYIDKALPDNKLLQKKMPMLIDKLITALGENNTVAH
ncbi:ribonuclease P protein component [Parasediminibacterium sp. JCM 36343]|uniref:ribonuclease P protein component n=1 Tax=Parasediminibacterium sp. JCM 36343 TaxID=3374279 RepID=UPI00397A41DE